MKSKMFGKGLKMLSPLVGLAGLSTVFAGISSVKHALFLTCAVCLAIAMDVVGGILDAS